MKVAVLLSIIALGWAPTVLANKCYFCYSIQTSNGTHLEGQDSCADGKKPSKNLVETCNLKANSPYLIAGNTDSIVTVNLPYLPIYIKTSLDLPSAPRQSYKEGCFVMVFTGTRGFNGTQKSTTRGCLKATTLPAKGCQTKSLNQWQNNWSDQWSQIVYQAGRSFNYTGNADAKACVCTGDSCNPAAGLWASMYVLLGIVAVPLGVGKVMRV